MRLAWSIAFRFLKSGRGQTVLIALGIAIGVSAQVFIGSLIGGLQDSLVDRTIGSASHVTFLPEGRDKDFQENPALTAQLRADADLVAVSESYDASGFVRDGDDTFPLLVRGVSMEDADRIYKYSDRLTAGALPATDDGVLIGAALAEKLDIGVGDELPVSNPLGDTATWTVAGLFDLQVASINESWVVAPLDGVRALFVPADGDTLLTSIETQIRTVFDSDLIAERLRTSLPAGIAVSDWKAENESLLSGLSGQSASSYMIQVFVLLAVGLGIGAVLAVSAVQKSRQLGILKAMGIQDRDASRIFLYQGILLGAIGAAVGTVLGILFTYAFSKFVQNPDGTALVPFSLDYGFIAISVVTALLAATIAALVPARASSRLNPIEVIRNG